MRSIIKVFLIAALLPALLPSRSSAIETWAGFIQGSSPGQYPTGAPQIFPIGDLVDLELLTGGEEVSLGTLPDMFKVRVRNNLPGEDTLNVVMNIRLTVNAEVLVDFWTRPFPLRNWVASSFTGDGAYTNRRIDDLIEYDWFVVDGGKTDYADVETLLGLIDGSNLTAGIYMITVAVEDSDGNPIAPPAVEIVQAFNPAPPQLQEPYDGEVYMGYPITFAWSWYGGDTQPEDWMLILVEGEEGEDPETMIETRSPYNTRFEGHPQTSEEHTYSGVGAEQALWAGKTYYWKVETDIPTVMVNQPRRFSSNIYSFKFTDVTTGAGDAEAAAATQATSDELSDMFSQILPSGQADMIMEILEQFAGYHIVEIVVEGQGGMTLQELGTYLRSEPSLEIVGAIVE